MLESCKCFCFLRLVRTCIRTCIRKRFCRMVCIRYSKRFFITCTSVFCLERVESFERATAHVTFLLCTNWLSTFLFSEWCMHWNSFATLFVSTRNFPCITNLESTLPSSLDLLTTSLSLTTGRFAAKKSYLHCQLRWLTDKYVLQKSFTAMTTTKQSVLSLWFSIGNELLETFA